MFGDNMLRTQISLDHDMYKRVKSEARRLGISVAELLRRALASTMQPAASTRQPWMRFAGSLESRDVGSSRSVDDVVYGRGRP
jgi:negative regulator of replication initiation